MIKQLDLPTFFITFTFVKRLGEPIIKALYTFHVKKLNLSNKMKHLEYVHIKNLIHKNSITCSKYYDHETSCFHTLFNKALFFGTNVQFVFVIDFEIVVMNMTFYGLNMRPYKWKKLKNLWFTFHMMFHLSITLQNAQHWHTWTCKKKIMLFVNFIIHYLPWV